MAKRRAAADDGLEPNPHLDQVLGPGAGNVSIMRGFIGTSERDGYVRLFPSLGDTSVSIDIPEDDVIDTADVKGNHLGKKIVWVKNGTQITVTKTRTTEYGVRPQLSPEDSAKCNEERCAGRLKMQVTPAAARDTCICWCDCSICQSHCTNWCGVCTCTKAM